MTQVETANVLRSALTDLREFRDECARAGKYSKAETINANVLRVKAALAHSSAIGGTQSSVHGDAS